MLLEIILIMDYKIINSISIHRPPKEEVDLGTSNIRLLRLIEMMEEFNINNIRSIQILTSLKMLDPKCLIHSSLKVTNLKTKD